MGWRLSGVSSVERVNAGRGTPKFSAQFPPDIFLLEGQELVPCVSGSASPSCTSGGTHSTKVESYLRIERDTTNDTWRVWGRDGTETTFTRIFGAEPVGGTVRWGQTSTVDTDGNIVNYTWSCPAGDCQPETISYNGFAVELFREPRPDEQSFAAITFMGERVDRLRSVLVRLSSGAPIRAYDLSYTTSPLTGRSLLSSV